MIEGKVSTVPGTTKEVALNDGDTVRDALAAAEMSVGEGQVAKLNGSEASMDASLSNGFRIIITRGAKGNV